jgi:hypothetical protein
MFRGTATLSHNGRAVQFLSRKSVIRLEGAPQARSPTAAVVGGEDGEVRSWLGPAELAAGCG